jgi:hypothetical protein
MLLILTVSEDKVKTTLPTGIVTTKKKVFTLGVLLSFIFFSTISTIRDATEAVRATK